MQPLDRSAPVLMPELAGLAPSEAVLPLHAALNKHLNGHEPDSGEGIEALPSANAIAPMELAEESVG
jgi:hypothetical protein